MNKDEFIRQFTPKLFTSLKDYSKEQFIKDIGAGTIVGIVALPLAIAFGIASGVSPEKGLYTAIIAGFIISLLGGSKVQIGGPTGAFIVIVYGIVQQFGIDGLIIATFIAGLILILFGLFGFGSIIKFIPHPLIVGFTSGIAAIIFSSQIKDLLGLPIATLPSDFIAKWDVYINNFSHVNVYAFFIAIQTIIISLLFSKYYSKIPGPLVAIIFTTVETIFFHFPIETIGERFGAIQSSFPVPHIPNIDFATVQKLIQPAFTIAILGGIESLLSAVVADGMIGSNHKSNMELVAQGAANIGSSIFGGIPATGAIARTATNIKNGARTPVSGMVHSIVLLLIVLFLGKYAALIPFASLAGILVIISYNMSEWRSFYSITKGSKSDTIVLLTTFFLTVLVDLTVAIEIGMLISAFLFMRKMTIASNVNIITNSINSESNSNEDFDDPKAIKKFEIKKGIEVFELNGPMFFGAAFKFKESLKILEKAPKVLILRMRYVPVIDATGLHAIEEVFNQSNLRKTKLVISGIQEAVYHEFERSGLLDHIGRENVKTVIDDAVIRANELLEED
jgi:SulP family sulfate permease